MQCFFVVDGDFFAGMNIPQGEEQYVAVQIFHVGVRLATVIDVMRAVASACAVQTATAIDVADAQDSAVATALRSFEIRDAFARVLRDLFSARKKDGGKATSAVDARRFDRETGCKSSLHQTAFYDRSPSGARFEVQSLRTRKILNESYLCSGSATPMRGKSLTCRHDQPETLRSVTANWVEDPKKRDSLPASQRLAAHRRGRASPSQSWFGCEGLKLRLAAHRRGRASP